MVYLEIQRGGGGEMKTSEFQQYFGDTVACTKILMRDTKGCGQMSPNNT